MSQGLERRLQCAAACAAIVAYAGLSHFANSTPGAGNLGTVLALAPATTLALVLAWRGPVPMALLATAGMIAAVIGLWPELRQRFALLSLLEECGLYGLLGYTFLRSLRPARMAVCTRLADQVHGPLSQLEVLYTRRVTAAWAAFFIAIAGVSLLLFAWAPLRVWSLYSNFGILPLVGAMFVVEHGVRRRVLPQAKPFGIWATVRVYFATPHSS